MSLVSGHGSHYEAAVSKQFSALHVIEWLLLDVYHKWNAFFVHFLSIGLRVASKETNLQIREPEQVIMQFRKTFMGRISSAQKTV
jgi:hypothetical protein